jgi:CheY-like chemotaxis protein/two-component sensor histidine kinase
LLTVINDILDFSKIESGKMDIEHEDFDLRVAVEDVMDLFSQRVAQQGIDLVYQIDENVPLHIKGDSLRLKQVLINLINNAVKFTAKGEIFVKVALIKKSGNDDIHVGFSIKDTGIGIPKEKLKRLFKAFSQVDSSTTRKYGGTGLGLVICERLVELMGGEISVKSKPGEGSVFSFFIKTEISTNSNIVPRRFDTTGFKDKRVLIVDDNNTNLTILKLQLEHWDMKPEDANSAVEALKILETDKNFDLIITDMEMPLMDGVGLTKAVKANMPGMPVIMLSSIGDETKKKFPGLFESILVKPVKQYNLCLSIQAALKLEVNVKNEEKPKSLLSVEFAREHPLNILVAEDNMVNQKLIIRILNKLGYNIELAETGVEVLMKTSTAFYDVILMDVQMPEMDGLEATAELRKRKIKQSYIVAMTANAMSEDRDICIAAGMNDYLTKPMKLDDLMEVLRKIK